MPAYAKFPVELDDMIIDETDERTLRACLFVSRSFRHRARRHLFQTIKIHDGQRYWIEQEAHRLKLLVELMRPNTLLANDSNLAQDAPHSATILPYIRHVRFSIYRINNVDNQKSEYLRQSLECCVNILQMLSNPACKLQSMEICGLIKNASWSDLASEIRSSLLHLCCSPSLDLTLDYIINVPKNILRGTTVRNFIVSNEVRLFQPEPDTDFKIFPEYDENSGMVLLPLPNLQNADIDNFDMFCDQLCPVGAKNAHKSMKSMTIGPEFSLDFHKTFNRHSKEFPNLQSLGIQHITTENNFDIGKFNICNLGSLKELTILSAIIWDDDFPNTVSSFSQLLPPMLTILKSCSNPSLSNLTLLFATEIIDTTKDGSAYVDLDVQVFSELDSFLASSDHFPSLRKCDIHFAASPSDDLPEDMAKCREARLTERIRSGFPLLCRTSGVEFILDLSIDRFPQSMNYELPVY